jgi:hypothetical protein
LGLAPKTARKLDADGNESDTPLEQAMKETVCGSGRGKRFPWTALSLKDLFISYLLNLINHITETNLQFFIFFSSYKRYQK